MVWGCVELITTVDQVKEQRRNSCDHVHYVCGGGMSCINNFLELVEHDLGVGIRNMSPRGADVGRLIGGDTSAEGFIGYC
jgi:hypothetical protein